MEARDDWFQDNAQVKMSLFQRWGILPAAGDRHLVEFLPGFTRSAETLFRWGVIRTPVSYRIERWQQAPQRTLDLMAGREPLVLDASGEESVAQMRALLGMGDLVTNVNVENRGQISNLPMGAVVETNARFRRNEVRALVAGALPPAVQTQVARHVANQEMIVEAALTRDTELAFAAVYGDPANSLPVDECWAMFGEMLYASRRDLLGWNIPEP